jgi:hypothetical protein
MGVHTHDVAPQGRQAVGARKIERATGWLK